MTDVPAPGCHADVPMATYNAWPFLRASQLDALQRSPAHYRYERDHPIPATASQQLGTAVHCRLLSPDHYGREVAVAPIRARRSTVDREWWVAFEAEAQGKVILDADQEALVASMASAVDAHTDAHLLLTPPDLMREWSLIWNYCPSIPDHPTYTMHLQSRIDAYLEAEGLLIDLKTTRDASYDSFSGDAWKYGYYRQLAIYARALATLGKPLQEAVIIAVENVPPHGVKVYRLPPRYLAYGWEEAQRLLRLIARCEVTATWPAYPDGIEDLDAPSYHARRIYGD